MEEKYSIKGIEKIIDKAGKEKLAEYYEVDIDADFESIITEDFKEHNIPNGLEVALYFSLTPDEYNKSISEGKGIPNSQSAASKIYEQDDDKRAMIGFNYMQEKIEYDENDWSTIKSGNYGNILYFFVNEPIKEENIGDYMYTPQYSVGGVSYSGLLMGKGYYEAHKDEIKKAHSDNSKNSDMINLIDSYIENFMKKFKDVEYLGGYGPKEKYEETDEIKKQNIKAEEVILELTGKSSIDELSLNNFISLKRNLEKREQELQQEFEDKFTKKEKGDRE